MENRGTRHISRICNKLQIPKLSPMGKIIGQHFSAKDFETSVDMVKENLKLFLRVISGTIIGEKQILKLCIFTSLFLSLSESTCLTWANVLYFTSKALFVLDKIKF